jgi:hypothetical protein
MHAERSAWCTGSDEAGTEGTRKRRCLLEPAQARGTVWRDGQNDEAFAPGPSSCCGGLGVQAAR